MSLLTTHVSTGFDIPRDLSNWDHSMHNTAVDQTEKNMELVQVDPSAGSLDAGV